MSARSPWKKILEKKHENIPNASQLQQCSVQGSVQQEVRVDNFKRIYALHMQECQDSSVHRSSTLACARQTGKQVTQSNEVTFTSLTYLPEN